MSDHLRTIFAAEDEDNLADNPVTIAYSPKTVQFTNHMIVGLQMDLAEIEELPKKLLREEAGCAFCLQTSVSLSFPFI